jgi:hypothetical protein
VGYVKNVNFYFMKKPEPFDSSFASLPGLSTWGSASLGMIVAVGWLSLVSRVDLRPHPEDCEVRAAKHDDDGKASLS